MLEQRERLEQLRALEGMRIGVACVDTVPVGVDTPQDLELANRILTGHSGPKGTDDGQNCISGRTGGKLAHCLPKLLSGHGRDGVRDFEQTFAALRDGAAVCHDPGRKYRGGARGGYSPFAAWLRPLYYRNISCASIIAFWVSRASVDTLTHVHSHEMALGQCRNLIGELDLKPMVSADTAGAARELAEANVAGHGAIASKLAAEIYGLDVLRENIEDSRQNTTRFLIMSASPDDAVPEDGDVITSFIFRVRNVPRRSTRRWAGLPPIMST